MRSIIINEVKLTETQLTKFAFQSIPFINIVNYCLVNKNCQVLVKNLNFVAGMTRRFVSAKRLRYFSNSRKLVEHRAQSPVREVKMLAVWPSIAEGFPTASRELAVGNPSAIEGQTANILTSRTGL